MKHLPIYRTIIILTLSFFIISCSNSSDEDTFVEEEKKEEEESNLPNILLIIADDMGLDATPGYNIGSEKPQMPNLQTLTTNGIRFNNLWSNPTCTPTRGTIITGKYGFRTNVTQVDDPLSTSEISIQKYLTTNTEYSNAVIGKWHLSKSATHPNDMGVNYYAGSLGGGLKTYTDWDLNINGTTTPSSEYVTSKLTDLAIDWVGSQTNPWFLWLSYNAPHTPFHLPPNDLHNQGALASDQASIDANPLRYYLAAIEAMDKEMGRLINSMTQEEKDNTIIIFIGDNGSPGQVSQNYPNRRSKGSVYQGGINVPMIVSGKGVTRLNEIDNSLINTSDLYATIADISGTGTNEIHDSKSFLPLLKGEAFTPRDFIYAEAGKDSGLSDKAIRNSTHKYILFEDGSEALYNLSTDALESTNLLSPAQLPLSDANNAIKNELTTRLSAL